MVRRVVFVVGSNPEGAQWVLLYFSTIIWFSNFAFMVPVEGTNYYAPEGTSGGILKSHRPSVRQSVRPLQIVSQRYLINYRSKFDETSQKDKA